MNSGAKHIKKLVIGALGVLLCLGWSTTAIRATETEMKESVDRDYYDGDSLGKHHSLSIPCVIYPMIYDFRYYNSPIELMAPEYLGHTFEQPEVYCSDIYFVDSAGNFVSGFLDQEKGKISLRSFQLHGKNDKDIRSLSKKKVLREFDYLERSSSAVDKGYMDIPLVDADNDIELFIVQNGECATVLSDSNANFYVILPTREGPKFQYKVQSKVGVTRIATGDARLNKFFYAHHKGVGLVQQDKTTGARKKVWYKHFVSNTRLADKALHGVEISCNRNMSRLVLKKKLTNQDRSDKDKNGSVLEFSIMDGETGQLLQVHDPVNDPDQPKACALEQQGVGYHIACANGKIKKYNEAADVPEKVLTIEFPKGFAVRSAYISSDCQRVLWSGITVENEVKRETSLLSDITGKNIITTQLHFPTADIMTDAICSPHDARLRNFMICWPGQQDLLHPGLLFAAYRLNSGVGLLGLEKYKLEDPSSYKPEDRVPLKIFLVDFAKALQIVRDQRQETQVAFEQAYYNFKKALKRGNKTVKRPRRPYPTRAIIFEGSQLYKTFKNLPTYLQTTLCRNFSDLFRIYPSSHPLRWCPEGHPENSMSVEFSQAKGMKRKWLL